MHVVQNYGNDILDKFAVADLPQTLNSIFLSKRDWQL
jgi:hypothetical protein